MLRRVLIFGAIIGLVLAGSIGTQRWLTDRIATKERLVCLRQQSIIRVLTENHVALETERTVLLNFSNQAAHARLASYNATHNKADLIAARAYLTNATRISRSVHFARLPRIEC